MKYQIILEAVIESDLPEEELNKKLTLGLHDIEIGYFKFDGTDDNLRVEDYQKIIIGTVCPFCADILEYRMVDVDGTNLVEMKACMTCQYKTS